MAAVVSRVDRRGVRAFWQTLSCGLLLLVLVSGGSDGLPARAQEAATTRPVRIVVVLRSGRLAPEEKAPRGRGRAPALWQMALEGCSVARLSFDAESDDLSGDGPNAALTRRTLRQWLQALLPSDIAAAMSRDEEAFEGRLTELQMDDNGVLGSFPPPPGAAMARLEKSFGAPPPPSVSERGAVAALLRATGAVVSASHQEPNALRFRHGKLDLTLVRVRSVDGSSAAAERRDKTLAGLRRELDSETTVFVLHWSGDGGSLVVAGRQCRKGRVLTATKSLRTVREAIGWLWDASETPHEFFQNHEG